MMALVSVDLVALMDNCWFVVCLRVMGIVKAVKDLVLYITPSPKEVFSPIEHACAVQDLCGCC